MQGSSISFTAKLKPTTWNEISSQILTVAKENNITDWTPRQIVRAKQACTEGIIDCSSATIFDGDEVVMLHLKPGLKENSNFEDIIQKLKEKVDLSKKGLKCIMVGCNAFFKDSEVLFEKLRKTFLQHNIPTSVLKGYSDEIAKTSIYADAANKTLFVTNNAIDSKIATKAFKKNFNKIYEETSIAPSSTIDFSLLA